MNTLTRWLTTLRARYRLWHGYCPECNSDAPAIDNCPVCHNYRDGYPPDEITKRRWWLDWQERQGWRFL